MHSSRYDAKADLWSVGTVLFEMISGEPPFHGENHIDLLRNIQRKAVRLPKDVRVSKECVNLLRVLLSRNPLSRAGFKEFFEACDAFVALGCQGVATVDEGTCKRPSIDLGTIPEYPPSPPMSESLLTVATQAPSTLNQRTPVRTSSPISIAVSAASAALTKPRSHLFTPLLSSPPAPSTPVMAELQMICTKKMPQQGEMPNRLNDDAATGLHNSTDENSFVMVEHGSALLKYPAEPAATTAVVSHYNESYRQNDSRQRLEHSPPSSQGFLLDRFPVLPSCGDYMIVKGAKGMLSTSPGTGGALMGMLTGRPQLTAVAISPTNNDADKQLEMQIKIATKFLAASEDVGRRAISVAHLGDKRAFYAMRLLMMDESNSSSIATPMEGIEEEESVDHDSGEVTDDSSSTEIMASVRRRRASSADRSMADVKVDDEVEEMPFAVQSESTPAISAGLPSRSGASFNKDGSSTSARPLANLSKSTPAMIRSHFSEALSCYLKALKMLKGAVSAAEGVSRELDALACTRLPSEEQNYTNQLKQRSEVTLKWLGNQFKGVLERGDAANTEIAKLAPNISEHSLLTSVEELLYNHSLGYGREGAVKQLLGHYEAARSCYRSAGLLAETLLMEPCIEGSDRKTLEGYVDGFAAQITELDELLLQRSQSRLAVSNVTSSYSSTRRGPQIGAMAGSPFSMHPGNK